jgi:hypothetical protein
MHAVTSRKNFITVDVVDVVDVVAPTGFIE